MNKKIAWLKTAFPNLSYSNSMGEAIVHCPFCRHHKDKLSINVETDKWRCFVCGQAGHNLIYLLSKVNNKEKIKEYKKLYKIDSDKQKQDFSDFNVELPESYKFLLEDEESFWSKRAIKYLTEDRELRYVDIFLYKIGLIYNEKFDKHDICVPSFDYKGDLNFYITRGIGSGGRYFNPKSPRGYKNSFIFNEIYVDWNKPILLVEGVFDALKTRNPNAIPLLGSELSQESLLFERIVENNSEVYLGLDPDADKKSLKIAKNLLKYDISVKKIDVNPYKDIGDMDYEAYVERFSNAIHLDSKIQLLKNRIQSQI